jgi:hypothetical protein
VIGRRLPTPIGLAAGVLTVGVLVLGFQLLRPRPPVAPPAASAPAAAHPSAPTPTAPAAAVAPVPLAPPTLPELARGTGAPAGDHRPVERALAARSAEELQLGGQLARAGLEPPPELGELFRRWHAGAPLPELRRFVVDRFPRDLKLRALTLDWLEHHPRP